MNVNELVGMFDEVVFNSQGRGHFPKSDSRPMPTQAVSREADATTASVKENLLNAFPSDERRVTESFDPWIPAPDSPIASRPLRDPSAAARHPILPLYRAH